MLHVRNNNILRVQSTDHINNLKIFLSYQYSNNLARHIYNSQRDHTVEGGGSCTIQISSWIYERIYRI